MYRPQNNERPRARGKFILPALALLAAISLLAADKSDAPATEGTRDSKPETRNRELPAQPETRNPKLETPSNSPPINNQPSTINYSGRL